MGELLIRDGEAEDIAAIQALFPLLASFDVPARRNPQHLWRGDEEMLLAWERGERDDVFVRVAYDGDALVGMTMTSLREELLSHEPSAHLEVVVVAESAQGRGLGPQLMADVETEAIARGARTLSLHVFGVNRKARQMYDRLGYDAELVRYIKYLGDSPTT